MKKVRWGVIGCGGIADKRTIPGMLQAGNAECVAVMDLNEETVSRVKEKYGIAKAFTSVEELLACDDIDAIYIATPVFCHTEQVYAAADAKKHILLEKPMALTCAQACELEKYCKEKGVLLGVGFMMRFHDAHRLVKEELEKGTIGETVSAYAKFNGWYPTSKKRWRQTKAFSGGGTMMDMGIHCIDLLQYMTGLKATEVSAMCENRIFDYPDTEDSATAILRMENGALFTVESNFNIPEGAGGNKFEIYGTKGSISAVGTLGQEEVGEVFVTVFDGENTVRRKLAYESGNMYTKETQLFGEAVLCGGDVPVTPAQAIFDQKIVEAVYESEESGKRINL